MGDRDGVRNRRNVRTPADESLDDPRVLRQIPGPVSIAPGQADGVTEHDRGRTVVEGVEFSPGQHLWRWIDLSTPHIYFNERETPRF
jgi:hypothetical protein